MATSISRTSAGVPTGTWTVSKQPCAANRRTFRIGCERVDRVGVGSIPLEHFGNALLHHEDIVADSTQLVGSIRPSARANGERLLHTR